MDWNKDVTESHATSYIVLSAGDKMSEAIGGNPFVMADMLPWMSCKCWQRVKFFTWAGVAGPDI